MLPKIEALYLTVIQKPTTLILYFFYSSDPCKQKSTILKRFDRKKYKSCFAKHWQICHVSMCLSAQIPMKCLTCLFILYQVQWKSMHRLRTHFFEKLQNWSKKRGLTRNAKNYCVNVKQRNNVLFRIHRHKIDTNTVGFKKNCPMNWMKNTRSSPAFVSVHCYCEISLGLYQ